LHSTFLDRGKPQSKFSDGVAQLSERIHCKLADSNKDGTQSFIVAISVICAKE